MIRVTDLGSFVARYGVMTEPSEWLRIVRRVESIADNDGDWELFLQERIAGLQEILEKRRERGEMWSA